MTEEMIVAARAAIRRVDGVLQVTTDALSAALSEALARSPGRRGTLARLRSAVDDAAAILTHTAAALKVEPFTLAQRRMFAKELRRGARLLRGLVFVSRASKQ